MSKARYMSITPHIYIRMLDGETKEQCEDRLVERIDPDGSAIIGWDESKVEIDEEGRSIWTTTMNIGQATNSRCDAPRVMTLEELKSCDRETIWFQVKSDNTIQQLIQDGIATLIFIGLLHNWNGYGTVWRCWTTRPTDEQRKAAKWDA